MNQFTAADLAARVNRYWGARVVRTHNVQNNGSIVMPMTAPWFRGYPPEIANPRVVVASHAWPPPAAGKSVVP